MLVWNRPQLVWNSALGAGPGPVRTYRVDLPIPWGDDTEITIPMAQMVQDVIFEARLQLPQLSRDVAEAVLPLAVERVNKEIPNWAAQLVREAEPAAKKQIDKLSGRVTLLSVLLLGGIGYVAWKVR